MKSALCICCSIQTHEKRIFALSHPHYEEHFLMYQVTVYEVPYLSGFCWKLTSFIRRLKTLSMHGRGTLFWGVNPSTTVQICTFNVVHEHLVLGSFLSPSLRECWYSIVVSHESGPHWTTGAGTGKGERKKKTWLNRQSENRTHSKASDKNAKIYDLMGR